MSEKEATEATATVVAWIAALATPVGALWVFLKSRLKRRDDLQDVELAARRENTASVNQQLSERLQQAMNDLARERDAHEQTRRELAEANQWRMDRLQNEADRLAAFRDRIYQEAERLRAQRVSSKPPSTSTSERTPLPIPSLPSPPKTPS